MKKIVAINASPRTEWNTGTLIREAAKGAESAGAEVQVIDLYKLDRFCGCISCFGCKLTEHEGVCIYKDSLTPVLEAIRNADGLIIGSPNYLGDCTAAFRALYERLVFQYITYRAEAPCCNDRQIPVLLLMTSNVAEEMYDQIGYTQVLQKYQGTLNSFIGPTKIMISGNTLQVHNYDRYNWTMFDPEAKKERRETVFPQEKQAAFEFGAAMAKGNWE